MVSALEAATSNSSSSSGGNGLVAFVNWMSSFDAANETTFSRDRYILVECFKRSITSPGSFNSNLTITEIGTEDKLEIRATWLRQTPEYYKIYCVTLNTLLVRKCNVPTVKRDT
jgi:hypothetical protein